MKLEDIKTIGVVGAGVMGTGIAQVALMAGYKVKLFDKNSEQSKLAEEKTIFLLNKFLEKGIYQSISEIEDILGKIEVVCSLRAFEDVDFVIEAIIENKEVKQKLFGELDSICRPEVIFASNTSSISIEELAKVTKRKDRVIGMHFMNPPVLVKSLEIPISPETSLVTLELVMNLAEKFERTPIIKVKKYVPGYIFNRLVMSPVAEAIRLLENGVGDYGDINKSMLLCVAGGKPMNTLDFAELVGLDTVLNILKEIYNNGESPGFEPTQLLINMVSKGYLGRKTKRGFKEWLTDWEGKNE